jgi:hypothetical protein
MASNGQHGLCGLPHLVQTTLDDLSSASSNTTPSAPSTDGRRGWVLGKVLYLIDKRHGLLVMIILKVYNLLHPSSSRTHERMGRATRVNQPLRREGDQGSSGDKWPRHFCGHISSTSNNHLAQVVSLCLYHLKWYIIDDQTHSY